MNGVARRGPSPPNPGPSPTPTERKCRGCREMKAPDCWYRVFGGTPRGDALGLDRGDVAKICPDCEERLREILSTNRGAEEVEA